MKSEKRQGTFEQYWAALERAAFKRAPTKREIAKPNKLGPSSKERRSSALMETKMPEAKVKQWLNRLSWLEQFHPGPLMAETYMTPGQITPERLANETGRSLEETKEILDGRRDVTAEIAESIERRFGWPAKRLLDWQRDYDEAVVRWHREFMADAPPYLVAQRCAEFKKTRKMLKKEVARFKKLALARLRSRAR